MCTVIPKKNFFITSQLATVIFFFSSRVWYHILYTIRYTISHNICNISYDSPRNWILSDLLVMFFFIFQSPPVPWRSILKSAPFWAILVAHMGQNYGYETLMTELPTFMKQVLHFNIKAVSIYLTYNIINTY